MVYEKLLTHLEIGRDCSSEFIWDVAKVAFFWLVQIKQMPNSKGYDG